jgi:hypothetical protein
MGSSLDMLGHTGFGGSLLISWAAYQEVEGALPIAARTRLSGALPREGCGGRLGKTTNLMTAPEEPRVAKCRLPSAICYCRPRVTAGFLEIRHSR